MEALGSLLLILIAALIYLLPGVIASYVRHRYAVAIWALNILLGWSGLGWVAALVWALMAQRQR